MDRRTIHYAMGGCVMALAAAVVHAIVRLFVLSQRVDASIFIVNVVVFAGIASFMIYLTKKEKDLKEKEFFSD
jgi:maltodextrin utilization protein YvdJ